jgi:DNA recombination protein RmuC
MIAKASSDMRLQAESLTKALKGDVKAQGNWGEVILERLLEESGLHEGREYTLQGSKLDLKDAEGRAQRPDVIMHLPEGKHIIIDAKVSLTHYEQYCAEIDEDKKLGYLKQFVDSLKQHINSLCGKGYQHHDSLSTPDLILMFLPIEGSFSLALQLDPQLFNYAWQRKIAIVHPSTLFAMLHTIKSIWKVETQNKNVQEIARQGGALYDKVHGFIKDMQEIGTQLKDTDKAYTSAMNKLVDGTGSLVSRTENLRKLGAKVTKQLPKELLAEEEVIQLEKSDA